MIEKHDRKCKDKYMKIILKDNWIELDIDISYPDYLFVTLVLLKQLIYHNWIRYEMIVQ